MNFIALLGWRPITEDTDEENDKRSEIFRMNELIELFDLDKVSAANAKLDESKLIYFNSCYLKDFYSNVDIRTREKVKAFKEKLLVYFPQYKKEIEAYDDYRMKEMIKVVTERIKLYEEIISFEYFFKSPDFTSEKCMKTRESLFKNPEKTGKILRELTELIRNIPDNNFKLEEISKAIGEYHHKNSKEIKHEDLYHLIRFLLTGSKSGATATKIIEVLGKEVTLQRFSRWLV